MGGHNAGEVASRLCVDTILSSVGESNLDNPIEIIKEAVNCANNKVREYAFLDKNKRGMGTTVVVATIYMGRIIALSVGDSRLYIYSNNKLSQITRDHSVVAEMLRMGSISKCDANTHPKRHMLTRAVGAEPEIDIDVFDLPIKGVSQILMATDGLTNMVGDKDILDILQSQSDIDTKVSKLVRDALDNGGNDNITLILIENRE